MMVAKIIRHRHKYHHYINDDLKAVEEEIHYKIVFSSPLLLKEFEKWCKEFEGEYKFNHETGKQEGVVPKLHVFKHTPCWCEIMTYYLVGLHDYIFHSTIHPYKGEVYIHD